VRQWLSKFSVTNVTRHQVFAQLEFQHKKKGSSYTKPAQDAKGYMNLALIDALEFLEHLRDT
jgi:hypothetical protein